MTDQEIEALLDKACDGTSYGANSAMRVSQELHASNMFLCSFYNNKKDAGMLLEARSRLAEARIHAQTTLELIEKAEKALVDFGEPEKVVKKNGDVVHSNK